MYGKGLVISHDTGRAVCGSLFKIVDARHVKVDHMFVRKLTGLSGIPQH